MTANWCMPGAEERISIASVDLNLTEQHGQSRFIAEVEAVMPKAFKLLAGGKRSDTTGTGTWWAVTS
jgi:hypothetical protein